MCWFARSHGFLVLGVIVAWFLVLDSGVCFAGGEDWTQRAQALLDAGNADEAFDAAELGLEYEPRNVELMELASKAAGAIDWQDEALYYAGLALETAGEAPEYAGVVKRLKARMVEQHPGGIPGESILADFAQQRLVLAQDCARKKFYVNAVDLYQSLSDSVLAARAKEALDALFEDKRAFEAMLASGADLPSTSVSRRSREWIAQQDRKHQDWKHAYDGKSDNYRIITDMGYEVSLLAATAMEQIGHFYRHVFHYKERGGRMPRCEVKIYKSRAEFDEQEARTNPKPAVRAFYVPVQNRVAIYDPTSDGLPALYLWSNLFHEASHQFTHAVAAGVIPGWLNEGTASYFEGARILPTGYVQTNRIPPLRALSMRIYLVMRKAGVQRGPALRDVVGFLQKGSYPGDYYPIGWSLVYFIHNYEDENSERVYVPIFEQIWHTYAKSGASHDPVERFVEFFVAKARQPGVKTFEDFEKRWADWMEETLDLYFGPSDRADPLMARARREASHGKFDAAVESYRWALEKRPGDAVAHAGLGECLVALGRKDAAALQYRQAMEAALAEADLSREVPGLSGTTWQGMLTRCEKGLRKIDRTLAEGSRKTIVEFASTALAAAQEGFDNGESLASLRLLDRALVWSPGNPGLIALRRKIRKRAAVDTRRWRRPRIDPQLSFWKVGEAFSAEDGVLRGASEGFAWATYREALPGTLRIEVVVEPLERQAGSLFGLMLGTSERGGTLFLTIDGRGEIAMAHLGESLEKDTTAGGRVMPGKDSYAIAVEIDGQNLELFVEGKSVASVRYGLGDLQPVAGVCVSGGAARFRDLRVRY